MVRAWSTWTCTLLQPIQRERNKPVRNNTTFLIWGGVVSASALLIIGWVSGLLFETILLTGGLVLLTILYLMWRADSSPLAPPEGTAVSQMPATTWQGQSPHQQSPQE